MPTQAVRLMPPGVERWVWVMDFHGFGLRDCNPKIAKIFLSMTSAHYPERLSNIVVIGAPSLFNGLWSMLKPLVPDVTKEKIRFTPYDVDSKTKGDQLRENLKDVFGEELLEWLVLEMGDSREQVKKKMVKVGESGQKVLDAGIFRLFLDWDLILRMVVMHV